MRWIKYNLKYPSKLCNFVRGLLPVWVWWSGGLTNREFHFGIGIIQGTIPSGLPVFWVVIPGRSRNSSGACPYLRVQKNSSSFDKAPKICHSIRLNFWDSFLLTLPSISSDTWVMYSSIIPGTKVFCDWPFLALSWVSPEMAANFRLFLSVVIMRRKEKLNSFEDWIRVFFK